MISVVHSHKKTNLRSMSSPLLLCFGTYGPPFLVISVESATDSMRSKVVVSYRRDLRHDREDKVLRQVCLRNNSNTFFVRSVPDTVRDRGSIRRGRRVGNEQRSTHLRGGNKFLNSL